MIYATYFCLGARVGNPNPDLLRQINYECGVISLSQAKARCHDKAIIITPTNKKVKFYNDKALGDLLDKGTTSYRSIALHSKANDNSSIIDNDVLELLFKHNSTSNKETTIPDPDITYAVGQRVRVTLNLGTQVGIFNGAQGTIHSFGFLRTSSLQQSSLHPTGVAHIIAQHPSEKPIIYVQMDKLEIDPQKRAQFGNSTDYSLEFSCSDDVPRLIPFFPVQSDTSIRCQGNKYYRHQYYLMPSEA
jgi:hypothetical protein